MVSRLVPLMSDSDKTSLRRIWVGPTCASSTPGRSITHLTNWLLIRYCIRCYLVLLPSRHLESDERRTQGLDHLRMVVQDINHSLVRGSFRERCCDPGRTHVEVDDPDEGRGCNDRKQWGLKSSRRGSSWAMGSNNSEAHLYESAGRLKLRICNGCCNATTKLSIRSRSSNRDACQGITNGLERVMAHWTI
jgi:hypothetical protein